MAPPQGSASYKKQNGILAISKDRKAVSWTPAQPLDASPTVVINAANVSNLQQTPESNPKVMLKIFAQDKGQPEPITHVFTFTSNSARAEANAIKDALASVIQAQKTAQNTASVLLSGGTSAAMTIANAISGAGRSENVWEDDERLKSDVALQQSLMREDPALQRTFLEARSLKPESMSTTTFTSQFWASKVHLLRAHALAKSQNRGTYNVFSSLRREEGGTKMNLNAEHIHKIFEQYPIVRRVYDEVVPKRLNEHDFWSRFFQSRLYISLRGLKIDDKNDLKDAILDPYLDVAEVTGLRASSSETLVPRTIDLEGNEENHSQKKGNRPAEELRPEKLNASSVIRTLNSLSEKLMAQVRPSDADPSAPIGIDEATYEELRLRDLAGDPEQNRIILKIQDQSRFFEGRSDDTEQLTPRYRKIDPARAVQDICADMAALSALSGAGVVDVSPDNTDDEDDIAAKDPQYITPSEQATKHIMDLVRQHRAQTQEISASSGLSAAIYERLILTHATTIEFLHQFWSAFLSGDINRAGEVTSLVESLNRAMDRIKAVADAAEEERKEIITKAQRQVEELKKRGERRRIDYDGIGGGRTVVNQLLGPVTKAVANATAKYQKAFQEQMANGDS